MKRALNRFGLIAAIAGALGLWSCSNATNPYGSSSGSKSSPSPNTVTMASMSFNPPTLTVAKGTSVTWQNNDGVAHTSTSDAGVWDSGNISQGSSKSVTFNTAGTFSYHCTIHPMMVGTIVVQ
jgi:plastocyanin